MLMGISVDIESIDIDEHDAVSIGMLLPEVVPIDMPGMLKGSCGSFATMDSNPNPGPA